MNYGLEFRPRAWKVWQKLDPALRAQFLDKLEERLDNSKVPASRLHGMPDCYKIELRAKGYRLVYQVKDEVLVVLVLTIGKRDGDVYDVAKKEKQ